MSKATISEDAGQNRHGTADVRAGTDSKIMRPKFIRALLRFPPMATFLAILLGQARISALPWWPLQLTFMAIMPLHASLLTFSILKACVYSPIKIGADIVMLHALAFSLYMTLYFANSLYPVEIISQKWSGGGSEYAVVVYSEPSFGLWPRGSIASSSTVHISVRRDGEPLMGGANVAVSVIPTIEVEWVDSSTLIVRYVGSVSALSLRHDRVFDVVVLYQSF